MLSHNAKASILNQNTISTLEIRLVIIDPNNVP